MEQMNAISEKNAGHIECNTEAPAPAKTAAQEHYEENGYYICRGLIPAEMIDRLLQRYQEEIVPSAYPFFRQTTSRYESNELSDHGYVKQSFLDIHDYKKYPAFSRMTRDIFTSEPVRQALREVTGFKEFNLMQTMLFDANAETVPHQDWWYLDTVPNGHLLAGWFALEDIDERAGRFFVMPKTQAVDLHSDAPNQSHEQWLQRMRAYMQAHPEQVYAPALNKGDVLFWNSRTIHGSLPTQDPAFSRKSLTAHYMPSGFKFGSLTLLKENISYKTYNGMKFYRTQQDYTAMVAVKSAIKSSALYPAAIEKLRKVQRAFFARQ